MKCLSRFCLIVISLLSSTAFVLAQEPAPAPSPATPPQESKAQQAQPETATSPGDAAATKSAEISSTEAKPTIYFYRIKQFAGSSLEPSVYCDEKELARMDNGRYFGVTLTPGKHVCRMGDKQTGFEIDVKGDQTYFAKVSLEAGFWKGHGRLTLIQPEQGGFELKKVKLLGASKVRNRELVTLYEGSEKKQ
ncbi:MAG TPA: DUF2846 domain-containing protein [Pyrinomonadaceae bacterium]|nr:DUF2846 domain-containing protein [Pyrinomonadaceae bacterium]